MGSGNAERCGCSAAAASSACCALWLPALQQVLNALRVVRCLVGTSLPDASLLPASRHAPTSLTSSAAIPGAPWETGSKLFFSNPAARRSSNVVLSAAKKGRRNPGSKEMLLYVDHRRKAQPRASTPLCGPSKPGCPPTPGGHLLGKPRQRLGSGYISSLRNNKYPRATSSARLSSPHLSRNSP